jgi:hypothetical protein
MTPPGHVGMRESAAATGKVACSGVGREPGMRGRGAACPFHAPCQALFAGQDAVPILLSGYRGRPSVVLDEGRLGGGAWGTGRGAAPPRFRGDSPG